MHEFGLEKILSQLKFLYMIWIKSKKRTNKEESIYKKTPGMIGMLGINYILEPIKKSWVVLKTKL